MKIVKIISRVLLCSTVCCAATACNDNIFVDRIPGFDSEIELTPGNPRMAVIPFDGIESIQVNCPEDYDTFITYYDHDGDELWGYPAITQVGRVLFGSPRFALDATVSDGEIKFTLLDNTYSHPLSVNVFFNYGYTSRQMALTLQPGAPMEVELFYVTDQAKTHTEMLPMTPIRYTNNGPVPQVFSFSPYSASMTHALVEGSDTWLDGLKTVCPLPLYSDGEWDMTGQETQIQFNTYTYIEPDCKGTRVPVTVPPHSTVTVSGTVTYAVLEIPFLGNATQPNSQLSFPADGRCLLSQPVNYQLNVQTD